MWMMILLCLSLSLVGVAGLQFFYMIYLDRMGRYKNKRIRELEIHCKNLSRHLQDAQLQIAEKNNFIDSVYEEFVEEETEEAWADLIEEN